MIGLFVSEIPAKVVGGAILKSFVENVFGPRRDKNTLSFAVFYLLALQRENVIPVRTIGASVEEGYIADPVFSDFIIVVFLKDVEDMFYHFAPRLLLLGVV